MNINVNANMGAKRRNRWLKWVGIICTIIFFPIAVIFVFIVLIAIVVSG